MRNKLIELGYVEVEPNVFVKKIDDVSSIKIWFNGKSIYSKIDCKLHEVPSYYFEAINNMREQDVNKLKKGNN